MIWGEDVHKVTDNTQEENGRGGNSKIYPSTKAINSQKIVRINFFGNLETEQKLVTTRKHLIKKKKKSQIYIKELCGIFTYSGPIPQPQLINGLEQEPMFPVQVLVLEEGE